MNGTAYTAENTPKHEDRVTWNWRKGTPATVIGREGKKVIIHFEGDKGRVGRAVVFASSLRLLERLDEQKGTVAA